MNKDSIPTLAAVANAFLRYAPYQEFASRLADLKASLLSPSNSPKASLIRNMLDNPNITDSAFKAMLTKVVDAFKPTIVAAFDRGEHIKILPVRVRLCSQASWKDNPLMIITPFTVARKLFTRSKEMEKLLEEVVRHCNPETTFVSAVVQSTKRDFVDEYYTESERMRFFADFMDNKLLAGGGKTRGVRKPRNATGGKRAAKARTNPK